MTEIEWALFIVTLFFGNISFRDKQGVPRFEYSGLVAYLIKKAFEAIKAMKEDDR